jgi:hypothetical protein
VEQPWRLSSPQNFTLASQADKASASGSCSLFGALKSSSSTLLLLGNTKTFYYSFDAMRQVSHACAQIEGATQQALLLQSSCSSPKPLETPYRLRFSHSYIHGFQRLNLPKSPPLVDQGGQQVARPVAAITAAAGGSQACRVRPSSFVVSASSAPSPLVHLKCSGAVP